MRLIALVALAFVATGCVGPTVSSTADKLDVKAGTNVARNTDGTWDSSFYGVTPTNVVVDDGGANVQTGGPNTAMGITLGQARVFLTNPSDTTIDKLTATFPDGTQLDMAGLTSTKSTVIAAYDQQVIQSLLAQGAITEQQAIVANKALDAGATLAQAIVKILLVP